MNKSNFASSGRAFGLISLGLLLALSTCEVSAFYGPPPPPSCGEEKIDGPYTCGNRGYVDDPGVLTKTSDVICVGGSTSSSVEEDSTTITLGDKTQPRHNDCGSYVHTEYISYGPAEKWIDDQTGLEVSMPLTFASEGTYTYTAKVYGTSTDIDCPDSTDELTVDTFTVYVISMEIKSPIDANQDGKRNDVGGTIFPFDRSTPNKCTIPCSVRITPDTSAVRSRLNGKVTVTLEEIANDGFTSQLTWNHSKPGSPTIGLLQYDSVSGLWHATATYTGLPAVPPKSMGLVPKGLHDLLYGSRDAMFTAESCSESTKYEVYFGDSVKIDSVGMADTTQNNADYISALVALGGDKGREMYEKMNCSTESFSFASYTKAAENIMMRGKAIELINAMTAPDYEYYSPGSTPPIFPRIGSTFCNATTSFNWVIGTYWEPNDYNNPLCVGFLQRPNTSAHSAIASVTPFLGECLGAIEICTFKAADYALGASQFDAVHPADDLIIGDKEQLESFQKHHAGVTDSLTLVPGDGIYMQNKDDYQTYSSGLWQGVNCIYVGVSESDIATFSGFGVIGKTEEQLRNTMKTKYEDECAPHTVSDPDNEIRFTDRARTITGM